MDNVKNFILNEIKNSLKKVQQIEIENQIKEKFNMRRAAIKKAIKELVANEFLEYVNEYGLSYLQVSFNKPVKLSKRIVLKPLGKKYYPTKDEVVIDISEGVAFGSGRHPTTALSINAIDTFLKKKGKCENNKQLTAIDIGTGSGVLAIAAVKLGVKKAIGIDIDPVAVHEASMNVRINHMEDQIKISDLELNSIEDTFDWVFANLRYPTLKDFYPLIDKLTNSDGTIILSGFKEYEIDKLVSVYTRDRYKCSYVETEKEWGCAVFVKK